MAKKFTTGTDEQWYRDLAMHKNDSDWLKLNGLSENDAANLLRIAGA